MKWYYLIILFSFNSVKAQSLKTFSNSSYIKSYCLDITENKTTNLIFPAAIKSVDRGSKDILAQKAGGIENILRVKADVKNFPETNLTVITADGKLYSFVVGYNPQPAYQSINIEISPVIYSVPEINRSELAEYCLSIIDSPQNIHSLTDTHAKVSLGLNSLYNKDDVLFFRLALINRTGINYDIDQFRFYIRDKQKAKRTATQEIEIKPLYISGDTITIKGHTHQTWVVALTKFTIPDGKYLAIEVMEKNGGRSLFIKVKNRHIMKSQML
ncbi:MAG: conjugative transposon protein TraN [Chitinophagaceae bacterium]